MRKVVTLTSLQTPQEQKKDLDEGLKGGFEVEDIIKTSAVEPSDSTVLRGRLPKTISVVHVVLSDENEPDDFDM